MQPARGWLVVLLCVLLAGCGGTMSQQTASPTVSPAPIPPTDASPTPGSFPPGVTATGVGDPIALAAAHATAANDSYQLRASQTIRTRNGSLLAKRAVTIRLGATHDRFHTTLRIRGPLATYEFGTPPIRAEFWSDGERYLRAVNGTEYGPYEPAVSYSGGYVIGTGEYWVTIVAPGGQPHQDIAPLFSAVDQRITDRTRHDGRIRYRLESVGRVQREALARAEPVGAIRNVTLTATIDTRGMVRAYRLSYTGRFYGRTVQVTRTVNYTDVGSTSVSRPAWYERAIGNTTDTADS